MRAHVGGFIFDDSGRPYYLVVDSGGLFVGRRYVVPVGRADFRKADRMFTVDLDKHTLKRYPEFHRDAFMSMTDEEARRYEWRVLEAIDPSAARSATREWDYDQYPYYRQPEWFDRRALTFDEPTRHADTTARRAREAPIVEREDRERVVAREDMSGEQAPREREKPPRYGDER